MIIDNKELGTAFKLLAQLMDIHGENSFKAKAYSSAAYKIEKESRALATLDLDHLSIPGIGLTITEKIKELIHTGRLGLLEEYLAKTPAGIVELLAIKGIGPKKIGVLWRALNIESIGELAYACQENRLIDLKGFGAKTQESILKSIEFIRAHDGYFLYADLHLIAENLLDELQKKFPANQIAVTGALRRQALILNRADFVTDLDTEELKAHFSKAENTKFVVENDLLQVQEGGGPLFVFHGTSKEDFYRTLFLSTNTEAFTRSFLAVAVLPEHPALETEIFERNNLYFIPPALREDGRYLKRYATADHAKPLQLLQPEDIKGIIHCHSQYSDGKNSLEEMALGAIARGYEYLVISDHSQVATYARGLYPEQIKKQHAEIDRLNQKLAPFRIFKSIEADILNDGNLDYTPEILASFDLVIASVHSNLKMNGEKAMQRLLAAIQNPFTTILGHPTGRLLLSREGYPIDHKTIIDACAKHNVVIEINAHPRRLDLDWAWIPYALEKGVLLSVDPDAHSVEGMDLVQYGVWAAQKGGLTKADNLSSKTLVEFEGWLNNK